MLDGAARIKPLIEEAAKQGMPAIAVTDHGNTFGAFEFYKTATETGIKPIIGMEAYVTPGTHRADKARVRWGSPDQNDDDVSGSGAYTHMTLLAESDEGLHNLFRMSSYASLEGYYFKPRIDRELLQTYAKGVIATTGCVGGEVQTRLRLGQYDAAQGGGRGVPRHLRQGQLLRRDHGPRHRHRAPHDERPAAARQGARPPARRDERPALHAPARREEPRGAAVRAVRLDPR